VPRTPLETQSLRRGKRRTTRTVMVDTPSERFWVWYASQGPGGLPRRPTVAVRSARCQVALVGIVVTGTAALGVPSKSACSAWARSHLSLPGSLASRNRSLHRPADRTDRPFEHRCQRQGRTPSSHGLRRSPHQTTAPAHLHTKLLVTGVEFDSRGAPRRLIAEGDVQRRDLIFCSVPGFRSAEPRRAIDESD
jgi:hypothetical protein